jgi:hypothetical protein
MIIYSRKRSRGMIPGTVLSSSVFLTPLIKQKQRAKKEKLSIIAYDHGSTVPNARGENTIRKMNTLNNLLSLPGNQHYKPYAMNRSKIGDIF